MVKQTRNLKKGSVGKKALSAILAASMIMSSSAFVMAAPVEEVAVEDAAVVEEVAVEEEVAAEEAPVEEVGAEDEKAEKIEGDDSLGTQFSYDALKKALEEVEVDYSYVGIHSDKLLKDFFEESNWQVTVDGVEVSSMTGLLKAAIKFDDKEHQIIVEGTGNYLSGKTGTATITYSTVSSYVEFVGEAEYPSYEYTGHEIAPKINVYVGGEKLVVGTDYEVTYSNNVDSYTLKENDPYFDVDRAPTVVIDFNGKYENLNNVTKYFIIEQADTSVGDVTVEYEAQEVTYNGSVQAPKVGKVTYKKGSDAVIVLKESDYHLEYEKKNTTARVQEVSNVGTYNVYVVASKADGNVYEIDQKVGTFKVNPKAFTNDNISVTVRPVVAGTHINNEWSEDRFFTVRDKATGEVISVSTLDIECYNKSERKWVDFSSMFANNMYEYGTYEIRIKTTAKTLNYASPANGEYVTAQLEVVADSLAALDVIYMTGDKLEKDADKMHYFTYDTEGQIPNALKMSDGSEVNLRTPSNEYFTATFPNVKECKNVGTYEIVLTGKENTKYAGQVATVPFEIRPAEIEEKDEYMTIEARYEQNHTEDVSVPYAVIKTIKGAAFDNSVRLVEGVDFEAAVDTAKKQIVITGLGNYVTSKPLSVAYKPAIDSKTSLDNPSIKIEVKKTYEYTGKKIVPAAEDVVVTEVGKNGKVYTLINGRDYTFSTDNDGSVGLHTLTFVSGTSQDYQGTATATFEIVGPEVSTIYNADESGISEKEFIYDGGSYMGEIMWQAYRNVKIRKNTTNAVTPFESVSFYRGDKKLTKPSDFVEAGIITAKYSMENCSGTLDVNFAIVQNPLSRVAKIGTIADQTYTGSAITPAVTVTPYDDTLILKEGRDYEISYAHNVDPGVARAIVKGIGNYDGEYVVEFNIVGQKEQSFAVLPAQVRDLKTRNLNSKATKIKFKTAPKTAVTYTSSDEDVVKVDAEGNLKYTGLGTATITIQAAETAQYKGATQTLTVNVGLMKPTFTPFSKNNGFTFTTCTVKGATQFEVQYVVSKKSFTDKTAVTKTFKANGKLKQQKINAADRTTYRIRVRAINGSTKSAWSSVKSVATK